MRNPFANRFTRPKTILKSSVAVQVFFTLKRIFQKRCSQFFTTDDGPKLCIGVSKIVVKKIQFLCTVKGNTLWKEVRYKLTVGKYFPKQTSLILGWVFVCFQIQICLSLLNKSYSRVCFLSQQINRRNSYEWKKPNPSLRPKPPPPIVTSTLQKSNAIAWFHRLGRIQGFVYIICQSLQHPRGERFLPGRWQPQGHAPAITSTAHW